VGELPVEPALCFKKESGRGMWKAEDVSRKTLPRFRDREGNIYVRRAELQRVKKNARGEDLF